MNKLSKVLLVVIAVLIMAIITAISMDTSDYNKDRTNKATEIRPTTLREMGMWKPDGRQNFITPSGKIEIIVVTDNNESIANISFFPEEYNPGFSIIAVTSSGIKKTIPIKNKGMYSLGSNVSGWQPSINFDERESEPLLK